MGLYRKKPPVVEAVLWDGSNFDAIKTLLASDNVTVDDVIDDENRVTLWSESSPTYVNLGYWVVKDRSQVFPISVLDPETFDSQFTAMV